MGGRGFSRLRLLLLKILSEKPLHGYALIKEVEELLGSRPSPGSIYPLLREMLREGLVEVRVTGSRGRIVKTYYITEKGRQYLASRREDLEELMVFVEGVRIVRRYGAGFEDVIAALARLVRLLPRLPEEERGRVIEFLRSIAREAERLIEEYEGLLRSVEGGGVEVYV
jgi:DNA-binding PadR family transcriptional regulator